MPRRQRRGCLLLRRRLLIIYILLGERYADPSHGSADGRLRIYQPTIGVGRQPQTVGLDGLVVGCASLQDLAKCSATRATGSASMEAGKQA